MKILVIDVGGSHVKILATGQTQERFIESGLRMTALQMVEGVKKLAGGWGYDRVSIGYPGVVKNGQPVTEPHNLAPGWVQFDYQGAFGKPVRIINDAAMQALGSYRQGRMLFLGLGTGLGTTLIVGGVVLPMELAHLPYRKKTFEDYVGELALERRGKKEWRKHVTNVTALLRAALLPDEVVIGGGNVRHVDKLPPGCRAGENTNAFAGGFRMWDGPIEATVTTPLRTALKKARAGRRASSKSA